MREGEEEGEEEIEEEGAGLAPAERTREGRRLGSSFSPVRKSSESLFRGMCVYYFRNQYIKHTSDYERNSCQRKKDEEWRSLKGFTHIGKKVKFFGCSKAVHHSSGL